jgi:hypothetical protein
VRRARSRRHACRDLGDVSRIAVERAAQIFEFVQRPRRVHERMLGEHVTVGSC